MVKTKLLHSLGPLFGIALFTAALWVLHHELKTYHLHDILRQAQELPSQRVSLAFLLTVLNYLIMTGYDFLALRYIQHPLTYGKTALASFIGYAFSNNIGLSMVAGGSVRFRLYSAWGLSAFEIAKVVAFCTLTLWLGFLTLAGVVFLVEPMVIPATLHLPFASARILGLISLGLVGFFFLVSVLRKTPLTVKDWEITLPSVQLCFFQTTLALLDWAVAGSVLYALLPVSEKLSFLGFLGIFLMAQMAGLVSQVPGGLGIFETVSVLFLSPMFPVAMVLGSLLVYRGVYYLLPLLLASILLGFQELFQQKEKIQKVVRMFAQGASGVVPQVLAFTTFAGGAMLLVSGATPAVGWRLRWLTHFLPLPVLEASHFLGSLAGVGLLLLARGLQRRIDASYVLTLGLLWVGILFSLLKGLDYEEAVILLLMFSALAPCRRYFYRKASFISERFSFEWVAAIIGVLICSAWLVLFSYKHLNYSHDLWWQFELYNGAPRSLRAIVGAVVVALSFSLAKLLRPAPQKLVLPGDAELERVSRIIQRSTKTYANLALLGDKSFLFSQTGNAFIMYRTEGRSWVALGDPVGPREEWPELMWRFRELCDQYDGWTVFHEVGSGELHMYLDLGLTLLKLGEEARVPLETFSLEGVARKGLRHTLNKLEKEGCLFELIPPEAALSLLPELRNISDAWLAEKNTREKGFSLGFFHEDYLRHFPVGIVRQNGKIVAFCNMWAGAQKEELSLDLMRYGSDAPRNVMEYLFLHLMLWGKKEGYRWFNLGMAPLAGLPDHPLASIWNRFGAFVYRYGEQFYNFQGLRQFKEKFDPIWEPKYLASPDGLALTRIITNIASLISGGVKGVIAK